MNSRDILIPQIEHSASLVIKFDTDKHSIDAALVGAALINLKQTIGQIATSRTEVEKTVFEVQTISSGCLEVATVVQFLQSIVNPETLTYLGNNIRDLFALIRFLKGKRPKEVREMEKSQKLVTNDSGEQMTFNNCTFHTYVNSSVSPLGDLSNLASSNIRSISIRMEKEGEIARVDSKEFSYFGKHNSSEPFANEIFEETEEILTIAKIPISNPARKTWGFISDGDSISAKICDEAFISKINERKIAFQQGDKIKAKVQKHQVFNEAKKCFVTKSRSILSISEFQPASSVRQQKLF